MKIFGYEIWASRTRYLTPLSLRFWHYRNWMGGMVFGVRLFGYKWECGYYGRNLTQDAPDGTKAAATLSGLYNCEVCGQEKCSQPGICDDCLAPPTEFEINHWGDDDPAPLVI